MKDKGIIWAFLTISLVSCTDWNEVYKARFADAVEPVKEKIDFFNAKYADLDKYAGSARYESLESLPFEDLYKIMEAFPKDDKEEKSGNYIVLNVPDSCGEQVADRTFFDFDLKSYDGEKSYWNYSCDSIPYTFRDEDDVSYYLERAESEIIEPMKKANYLLVIEDKILVKPHSPIMSGEFEGGYVLAEVQVFDLKTKKKIDTFNVAAQNSQNVKFETDRSYSVSESGVDIHGAGFIEHGDWTLIKDLYSNLKKNAKLLAEQRRINNK